MLCVHFISISLLLLGSWWYWMPTGCSSITIEYHKDQSLKQVFCLHFVGIVNESVSWHHCALQTVIGTDIAELLLREHRSVWLPGKSPNEANLIDFNNDLVPRAEDESCASLLTDSFLDNIVTECTSKDTERFRELLLFGRKKVIYQIFKSPWWAGTGSNGNVGGGGRRLGNVTCIPCWTRCVCRMPWNLQWSMVCGVTLSYWPAKWTIGRMQRSWPGRVSVQYCPKFPCIFGARLELQSSSKAKFG